MPPFQGLPKIRVARTSNRFPDFDDRPRSMIAVVGTRPECIKLAPFIRAARRLTGTPMLVANSGQHSAAVRQTLLEFNITADVELPALPLLPNLNASQAWLRRELGLLFERRRPQVAIVQGDTLTAYCAARAAHDTGCTVAHVEAGLRTDQRYEPFPEEWFRRRMTKFVDLHFAPTPLALQNLLAEGVDAAAVHVTGNTGIDTLKSWLEQFGAGTKRPWKARDTVLVTLHRRSNHHRNASIVCDALIDLCAARPDLKILFPVHPNPGVSSVVRHRLNGHPAVELVAPMLYRDFIAAAANAALIISDSGGIQEEAPHLGTPLLVPRCNTERPECLATGFVQLVAVDRGVMLDAALKALRSPRRPRVPIDGDAPFGAGNAAVKIVRVIEQVLREPAAA